MEPATTLTLIQIPQAQARDAVADLEGIIGVLSDGVGYEDAVALGLLLRLDDECPEVPAAVWRTLWRKLQRWWDFARWAARPPRQSPPIRLLGGKDARLAAQALVRWQKAVVRSDGSDALAMDILAVEGLAYALICGSPPVCGDELNQLLESVIECVGFESPCGHLHSGCSCTAVSHPRRLSSHYPIRLPLR